jgi:PEGA domain
VSPLALIASIALLAPPHAGERIAVLAVHEPAGLDLDLIELTHQLRAACAERVPGVLQAPEMRARLSGRTGNATAAELDRAFNGALAVYQNGEYESAESTLKAIVADLEELPESEGVWHQWTRAMMRLSHVQFTLGQREESDATQLAVLKADSSHQLDPMLYAPGYRAHFDDLRARVRVMPKRRLTVTSRGRAGTIYVGGRDVGSSPVTVIVPAGGYRVAGAAGELRPPSVTVDLAAEDRTVTLDFALAEAVRIGNGPALALPPNDRGGPLVKAGAWLGVDRLVVTTRVVEGDAPFLVGAVYDVRRGALLREGSVRVVGGAVPAGSLGALAAFLLTGTPSREVNDRARLAARPAPRPASPPPASPVAHTGPPPSAPPAPPLALGPRVAASGALAALRSIAGPQARPATPAATAIVPAAPLPSANPPASPLPELAPASAPIPTPAPAPAPAAAKVASVPASSSSSPDLSAHPPPADPLAAAVAAPPGPPPTARPRSAWLKPAAIGVSVLALGLAGVSVQQGWSAHHAYSDADALVLPGGVLAPGVTPADRAALVDRGDTASRNAWVSGTAGLVAAAGAGLLWWLSP